MFQSLIVIYKSGNVCIVIGDVYKFIGQCLIPLNSWLLVRYYLKHPKPILKFSVNTIKIKLYFIEIFCYITLQNF